MKIKTRKLIAAITATALLGSALGISAYAIDKTKNDFGFKGTYDLSAFAAASETKTNVMGVDIDVTNTLTITSEEDANTDGKGDYTLFLTVVDTSDMASLNGIKVGYKIGDTYYNGTTSGLSNVMYNGLTLRVGEDKYETIKAADYTMINSVDNGTAIPYFVITEVETADIGADAAATLTIEAKQSAANVSVTVTGDGDATAGTSTIIDAFGQELTIGAVNKDNATLGADPFYVNKAKTVYFEGEGKDFRIPNTAYLQTAGADAPLYLDLTGYEEGVDMLLTINASSTGSSNVGHLNRYLIIRGNGQNLESQPLNVSGNGGDCKFIVKSGYKYQIDNSNGLRIYSISYATATATDEADVLEPVTVTVKDKSGNTIATITEDSTLIRPTLYVGSALTSAGATAAITAALPENATWDGKIYTDEACSKTYSETTRLTGDITLYVDVAYPTQVAVNYNSTEYPITKIIGSELTLDEIVAALGITVADNQKLVCKVDGSEVTFPVTVTEGLTINAELVTATTIDIANADGSGNVGEVKITADTTMTYAELSACIKAPDGKELSAIYVKNGDVTTELTSTTSNSATVTNTSEITATFITATSKTETVDMSTLSSSYAVGATVYDCELFTMSTKIKLAKKGDYIVTNSGKTDSTATPIVFTAKKDITLSLKANVGNSSLTGSFGDTNTVYYQVYNSDGTTSGNVVSAETTKTSTFIDISITLKAGQYVNLYFITSSTSNRYFGFSFISANT